MSKERADGKQQVNGWRPGCAALAGLLGIAGLALMGMLLMGYSFTDLLAGVRPERDELVEELDELPEVVDAYYSGDEEEAPKTEDGDEPVAPDADEVEAEPSPEADPEPDDEIVKFVDAILGVSARAYNYYQIGSTAGRKSGPDPYVFIDPNACLMKVEVRTMPTAAFPGATAAEGLAALYQTRYVDQARSDVTWTVTEPPFEIEQHGDPAARMEATRIDDDRTIHYQLTAIRGPARSALVHGQIGDKCAQRPASVESLHEMTDAIALQEPAAVCYVGRKPGSEPAAYAVGCDYPVVKVTGPEALADQGFTEIELGPATWDACAAFMREQEQPFWTE